MSPDSPSYEEGPCRHPDPLAAGPGRDRFEETTMNSTEALETTSKDRNPITTRRIVILLALLVAGLVAFRWGGQIVRRAEFLLTDAVTIDGRTFYLDKNDQ